MKAVFIIDSLRRHGAQRFLVHLLRGLVGLGYDVSVIVLNAQCASEIRLAIESLGARTVVIGKPALLLGGFGLIRLVSQLKKIRPDVVMTLLDFADTMGRPAARVARSGKIVTALRVRNLAKPWWRRWVDRRTVGWADAVVLNSRHLVEYAVAQEGVRPDQITIIANGVEDLKAQSSHMRERYRARLELGPEVALVGAVGRLEPQKNIGLLLRCCAALKSQRQWKLVIVGDGSQRRELMRLAENLQLQQRVTWAGECDDVPGWLAAMDLFVHTSDFEGMPNAVMEAMAMGLPVVASDVDGTRELVRHGETGYLVAAGDRDGFTERVAELLENPHTARAFGTAAHADVLTRFAVKRMVFEYDRFFRSLTNRTELDGDIC
jgi:glycosyltransferase involved in cell wall biosynthesis